MAAPSLFRGIRPFAPELVLALVVVFAAVTLWQAWAVIDHLRQQAHQTSRIYAEVTAALADPEPGAETATLFDLVRDVRQTGIPLVVTYEDGRPALQANTPFSENDPALLQYVQKLDRNHAPIAVPGVGELHFGTLPAARRLTLLTLLQIGLLVSTMLVGIWAYRSAVSRDRDRLWVAMARESAHQLGTPLMSAGAWVDRLEDGSSDIPDVAGHLRADLERLHRVAQRFERIGRPARRDRVALGAVAERVATYFQPRLPRHANAVKLTVDAPDAGPTIVADATLIEWAMEALVRNAVDALSGRGGNVRVTIKEGKKTATIRVTDDGPGIPVEVRASLFEPGVTTKPGGWGIGLALARRIVEDVHQGTLSIDPIDEGTAFVAELPKVVPHTDD